MVTSRSRVLARGLVAGLIGYTVVAVFFAIDNLVHGRPFFATAAQLGAWILGRGAVAPAIPLDPAPVFAFNGVHLVLTLVAGTGASALVSLWESKPEAGYIALFGFLTAAIAVMLYSVAIGYGMAHAVSPLLVLTANTAALIAVVTYLFMAAPALREHWLEFGDQ